MAGDEDKLKKNGGSEERPRSTDVKSGTSNRPSSIWKWGAGILGSIISGVIVAFLWFDFQPSEFDLDVYSCQFTQC